MLQAAIASGPFSLALAGPSLAQETDFKLKLVNLYMFQTFFADIVNVCTKERKLV